MREKPIVTIPKGKAVFRLDKNAIWRKGDEKFTNQKIIDYFHSIIKKDKDGHYFEQEHTHFIEKVYFPYEDTPLFAIDVVAGNDLAIRLNTGETVRLDPQNLLIKGDNLYYRKNGDLIKFNADALVSISEYMDDPDGQYIIELNGKSHRISRLE